MKLGRRDVIQKLIDESQSKYYLEVGIAAGNNFINIKASHKIGVGPIKPSELVQKVLGEGCQYFQMLSDDYFAKIEKDSPEIRFDVVFVDGLHEYKQAYRDIANALRFLSPKGILVVHDCIPINEIASYPPEIYNSLSKQEKQKGGYVWMGDVWKAILHLRTFHDDVSAFTLDCDCGLGIVYRNPNTKKLSYTEDEIVKLTFSDFEANKQSFLDLQSPEVFKEFCFRLKLTLGQKIYAENVQAISAHTNKHYLISKPATVNIVENGIILPLVKHKMPQTHNYFGGVCDNNLHFFAGLSRFYGVDSEKESYIGCTQSYEVSVQSILYEDEAIVFGGIIASSFGHFIVDSLTRLWWFLHNDPKNNRIAFLIEPNLRDIPYFFFLQALGISEDRILIVKEPTRFKSIIVPEQSFYYFSGYTSEFVKIYNKIRDSVTPSIYKKIYLTKTKWPGRITNEEYFERYFDDIGYKIIAPEQYTIEEQIAFLAGADDVACTVGSISHLTLFCKDNVNLFLLLRSSTMPSTVQAKVDKARKANVYYIEAIKNLLPTTHSKGMALMAPTMYWQIFLKDMGLPESPQMKDPDWAQSVLKYLLQYTKVISHKNFEKEYPNFTIVDFLKNLEKYLLEDNN